MHGIERGSKITAINRRDCKGRNRTQALDVIPVIDMATMLLQTFIRRQCPQRGLREFSQRQKTQLVSSLTRIEEHAEIRGRQLAHLERIFLLHIVRDQPVILRSAELRKVTPYLECLTLQKNPFFCLERTCCRLGRRVQPRVCQRLHFPKNKYGSRRNECVVMPRKQSKCKNKSYHWRKLEIKIERASGRPRLRLSCCLPIKKMPA